MDNLLLGDRILFAIRAYGHSQDAIAASLDVSPVSLNRYIKGHRVPDADFLIRLVAITGCDAGWLLTGKERAEGGNERINQRPMDTITEKIHQHLEQMCEDQKRDVLKYAEEKKLLSELMSERQRKTG